MDLDFTGEPLQPILKIFCPGCPSIIPCILPVFHGSQLKRIGIEVHIDAVKGIGGIVGVFYNTHPCQLL